MEPKQLTARHAAQNLREHLLGFLAVNGFPVEDEVQNGPFMQALLDLSNETSLASLAIFKRRCWCLLKVGEHRVKLGRVHQLASLALGYQSFAELQKHVHTDGSIRNIRSPNQDAT